jgi:hypothetical protein
LWQTQANYLLNQFYYETGLMESNINFYFWQKFRKNFQKLSESSRIRIAAMRWIEIATMRGEVWLKIDGERIALEPSAARALGVRLLDAADRLDPATPRAPRRVAGPPRQDASGSRGC